MDKLADCISQLDSTGLDVLKVGCKWQEKTPATLTESADLVTGVLVFASSIALLYMLSELARDYFGKWGDR